MSAIVKTRTQGTLTEVRDEGRGRFTLDAHIPALGSNRDFKFLKWRGEGQPPPKGTSVMLEVNPVKRSNFYVNNGTLTAGPIDGTEAAWQVDWEILAAEPWDDDASVPPTPPQKSAVRPSESVPAVFVDANQQQLKDNAREEGVNDRKAVTDILLLAEAGTYTLDGLLEDAERLAEWYNVRRRTRLDSGMVGQAQEMGAVITSIAPEEHDDVLGSMVPLLKNLPELDEWIAGNGWEPGKCRDALGTAGYASRADYLAKDGNSVMGLAEMLKEALSW